MDRTDRQTTADDDAYRSIGSMKTTGPEPTAKSGRFRVGDSILGRYTILSELGQGGMGVVYKCLDTIGGIEVALKALPPELSHDREAMEEIRENFQIVSRLHHPNIANVNTLEVDDAFGDSYLIMEYVNGETLHRWMRNMRRGAVATAIPLADVLPILRQVAAALDYAHSQRIMHRDIKPGNVVVTASGTAKVLDFGLAAEIFESMSRAHCSISGARPYMSPEQWRGRPQGAATDQYSLAVTAYEMLAGQLPNEPFAPDFVARGVPDAIPGLSHAAMAAISRAMAKEPSERFANCADFVAALGGNKIHAKTPRPKVKKGIGIWVLSIAAVLGIGYSVLGVGEKPLTIPGLGMELMPVAAGSFLMGSKNGESDEKPLRTVRITRDFWIGKTEVTNGEYDQFVRESGCAGGSIQVAQEDDDYRDHFDKGIVDLAKKNAQMKPEDEPLDELDKALLALCVKNAPTFEDQTGTNYPVVCVSWKSVEEFCKWLTQRERMAGRLPSGYVYRLPTEAEWEYAAKGGNKSKGYIYSGGNDLDSIGWFQGAGRTRNHPVGQKEANELGLYDMSGSVWELCADWYQDSYSGLPDTNPKGPSSGSLHVGRGGSWLDDASICRLANRFRYSPSFADSFLGFRVVLAPVL